ncbi:MAG: CYTH domain-containing protein [Pseudonocardiales bacterium]|nr:CYTH domain-containing protein [Pseudonocardiales bacterium]MBV9031523.1 CYTH domain-containing protein [Pseudonocardiales bacterium]MBW0008555.1 CYTH domain-containing protein [Pseudonocardiales bacterium]
MAVEAELKALARNPGRIHAALSRQAVGERSTYSDRYFDYPDRGWTRQSSELRVRTVTDELGRTRALLTFKEQLGTRPADRNLSTRRLSRMPTCWSPCSPHSASSRSSRSRSGT